MELLYKLYDMEYFAVGLLIVIAILVFLFLLILFFGKKDEKQRKLEETNKINLETANGFKEIEVDKEELIVPEIPQPSLNTEQEEIQQKVPTFEEPFINEPLKVENSFVDESLNVETPVIEPVMVDEMFISDITTDLNESEFVEDEKIIEPTLPEIDVDNLFQINLDEISQNDKAVEDYENSKNVNNIVTSNDNVDDRVKEEIKEQEKINKTAPVFELPKMAEMPKLKEETNNDFDTLFGDVEPETYDLKK